MSIKALVIVSIFISILYSYLDYFKYKKLSIVVKACATLSIIVLCIVCYRENPDCPEKYFLLMLTGLSCGLIGDVLLAMRKIYLYYDETFMLVGTAAFLAGHLFYITAFNIILPIAMYDFLFGLIIMCVFYLIKTKSAMNFRHISFAISCYAAVIAFLLGRAFSILLFSELETVKTVIFAGSLAFVLSDTALAFSFFYNRRSKLLPIIVHTLYFPAQILLALSVLYFH